jgi:anti-sigma B factor antagonist
VSRLLLDLTDSVTDPPFELRLSRTDQAVIVEVVGEIDMATAPELAAELEGVGDDSGLVVVDLAQVTFVDSSGLKALVQANRELGRRGIGFRVVSPADHAVRRIFEITQLTEPLNVVDSLDDALAS